MARRRNLPKSRSCTRPRAARATTRRPKARRSRSAMFPRRSPRWVRAAWSKVREIGHVVINFNGATEAERPGEICASEVDTGGAGRGIEGRRGHRLGRSLIFDTGLPETCRVVEWNARRSSECMKDLHARPATRFVRLAKSFEAEVEIVKEGKAVSAKSSVKLMLLSVKENQEVTVRANGADAAEAVEALIGYLENPQAGLEEEGGADATPAAESTAAATASRSRCDRGRQWPPARHSGKRRGDGRPGLRVFSRKKSHRQPHALADTRNRRRNRAPSRCGRRGARPDDRRRSPMPRLPKATAPSSRR